MVSIPSEIARAVVLRHFPRVLRAGLDPAGRNGAMPMQLAQDARAIRPPLGRTVRAWLARPYLPEAEETAWRGRRSVRTSSVTAAGDPLAAAVGTLSALDVQAARMDLPALREIADAALLLGFSGNVQAAAGRVAAAAWPAIDRLPEVGATLRGLAMVSAGTAPDGMSMPWHEFVEADEDARLDHPLEGDADVAAAAIKAWQEALGRALNDCKAEASVLALGLSAMDAGRTLPYYADSTLAAHALAVGRQETGPIERKVMAELRRRQARPTAVAPRKAPPRTQAVEDKVEPVVEPGFVVVCPPLPNAGTGKARDIVRGYEHVIDTPVPLVRVRDLTTKRAQLLSEFPYAAEAIDTLIGEFVGKEFVSLPAFLIEGPPGAGKSRLVRRFGEVMEIGTYRVDASADAGASIAGTERRWWSTEPCRSFMAIARNGHANPILAVDEIDKAPTRPDYGRAWDALLQMIEPENAARYPDPSLQVDVNIRWVSVLCLANDASKLPGPLLDRLRVVRFPEPGPEHLDALVPGLFEDIARERGLDPRFFSPLDGVERAALRRRWRGGSVRRLRRAVEAVLRVREKLQGARLH